jgi:hypothetical protein
MGPLQQQVAAFGPADDDVQQIEGALVRREGAPGTCLTGVVSARNAQAV